MKILNRAALLVRPKEPYIEWAASLDEGAREAAQVLRGHTSVYLVREDPPGREESGPLRSYFQVIFEEELGGWSTDKTTWPKQRDLRTVPEWFDVQAESIVFDLSGKELPLKADDR